MADFCRQKLCLQEELDEKEGEEVEKLALSKVPEVAEKEWSAEDPREHPLRIASRPKFQITVKALTKHCSELNSPKLLRSTTLHSTKSINFRIESCEKRTQ